MRKLSLIGRAGVSLAVALGTIGAVVPDPAEADPEACGYVRYGTNTTDTTTTLPYLTYCGRPCPGSGPGAFVPHQQVGDAQLEGWVCLHGI